MLLIYLPKITTRADYVFKHICTRILGIPVEFTTTLDSFIAHPGPKFSYGKQPLGNELFFQSHELLFQQGFEDVEVHVRPWEDTIGFFAVSEKSALPFDIFSAAFYLLSRYEEYLPHVKDELGRFPASESLAHKEGFLQSPVVDEWAYKLKDILTSQFPDLEFPKRAFRVHNIVEAKRPFEFLQRGVARTIVGFASDLWKLKLGRMFHRIQVLFGLRKDPYDTFTWILNNSRHSESELTVFFLLGEGFSFREDFNTKRERFQRLVKYVNDYKEVGLVFSFHSLNDYEKLKEEKEMLEDLTHRTLKSSFNDRQLVNLPTIYRHLLELEVERDYTLFYFDEIGFRAGTCTPFLFYDLDYEVKTPLVLQPVIGKSLSLKFGKESDVEGRIMAIYRKVQSLNGCFSFQFSNRDFEPKKQNKTWRYLYSEIFNTHA